MHRTAPGEPICRLWNAAIRGPELSLYLVSTGRIRPRLAQAQPIPGVIDPLRVKLGPPGFEVIQKPCVTPLDGAGRIGIAEVQIQRVPWIRLGRVGPNCNPTASYSASAKFKGGHLHPGQHLLHDVVVPGRSVKQVIWVPS